MSDSQRPKPDLRLRLATWIGGVAAAASRITGRGSGASIRGQVMLRIDPASLAKLLPGRRTAVVSGTNGKTTTTHLLAAAVAQDLADRADTDLVTNADGANLHHGLASALSRKPDARYAVLETDERVVADVVRDGSPEVLVLLNFSRDQLDRHHEIKRLAQSWRDSLVDTGYDGPIVVANSSEPLIVWASQNAYRVVWVDAGSTWVHDSALCPECGSLLRREPQTGHGTSTWACGGCGLAQPRAHYRVDGPTIIDPMNRSWLTELQLPGQFNVANAACALAASTTMGLEPNVALSGMSKVTSPAGRFAVATVAGVQVRLVLAKNPAGWAEALNLAQTPTVVLAIDSAAADGRDVSWLWDVDFEQLRGRRVIATGPRASDLAVRLDYAEVDYDRVPELSAALAGHDQPVDVIATYTAFQALRRLAGV